MAVSSRATLIWKRALLSLCALGIALVVLNLAMIPRFGFAGIDVQTYRRLSVIAVHNGSSAARAGLRTGDVIDTAKLSNAERYRWFNYWTFGERMILAVHRTNRTRMIPVVATGHWRITNSWVPSSDEITWDYWLYLAGDLWICAFVALIAFRRPGNVDARLLAA